MEPHKVKALESAMHYKSHGIHAKILYQRIGDADLIIKK